MIEKPSILVTSIGRTGTEFFARMFSDLIPDSTSLHEPDIFQNTGVDNKWGHYLSQVRRAGIWRMMFLKALGKWTLVKLPDARFLGRINRDQALRGLVAQRKRFVEQQPGAVYIEANIGYYGLLDLTTEAFENHRAVYIVRDGRDWVRSHYNWGEFYGKKGFRKLISHNWPCASDLSEDPYAEKWDSLSRFEQLCWAWSNLNQYALDKLSDNPFVKVYRFEQIFSGDAKYDVLADLVSFATSLPGIDSKQLSSTEGWLERKIHPSPGGLPVWDSWTREQKTQFKRLCGSLMEKLGYEIL